MALPSSGVDIEVGTADSAKRRPVPESLRCSWRGALSGGGEGGAVSRTPRCSGGEICAASGKSRSFDEMIDVDGMKRSGERMGRREHGAPEG